MENVNLLEQTIGQLNFSNEFQDMCVRNKFKTLSDIVKFHVSDLLNKPGFGMRMLNELIEVLEENKSEEYLKD